LSLRRPKNPSRPPSVSKPNRGARVKFRGRSLADISQLPAL